MMKKRTYDSTSRRAQAAQTRIRILDAAKGLFEVDGFESTTIENIAVQAGVSEPTVFALFGSKRGVLRVLMDEALPSEQRLDLVEQTKNDDPPHIRLRLAAKIARQLYDAEKTQMKLFQGAAVLHPQFKELEAERERRRYRRLRQTVERLAKEGMLAPGLSVARARDILWAYTGRDFYRMLVIERKWSSDEYETWLAQEIVRALLEPLPQRSLRSS